jgi:hypothetical protein
MRTILGFIATLFLVGSAQSATLWNEHIGRWLAGAYSSNQDGSFSHCAATADYNSNILLLFAVDKKFGWGMGFSSPSWHVKPGMHYNVSYWIDNGSAEYATAVVVGDGLVKVELKDSPELFNTFRRGNTLYVNAQGTTVPFNLTNTSQVLTYLLQCANNGGAKPAPAVAAAPNLFGTPGTNTRPQPKPQVASGTAAAERAEATALAANIVSELGITGFKFLPPEQTPADAAWIADNAVGAVTVLPKVTDASEFGSVVIGRDAKECKTAYASGSMPGEGEGNLARLFTRCGVGKEAFISYYLVVPRKASGVYLIGIYGYEQNEKVSTMEAGIRSAAFRVLQK